MNYKIKSAFQKFATTAITLSGVMTAAGITLSAQSAQALNFSLAPTQFTVIQGIGDNNALSSIAVNTSSAPANGFGTAFTSNFLLLGANITDANIPNDSLKNNNSVASSIPFAVSSSDATQPITVTFNWAFNGNSTGNPGDQDSFLIQIAGANGFGTFFQRLAPNYGSANSQTSTLAPGTLLAGDYQIFITLNENTDFFNRSSAAGFNNISLSTPGTPVPFGFSTNTSLLVFGGMFYGMNKLKKKMAVKKFQA